LVPQRLTLRNFLCYRENVEPLDLSGIGMACLSGDNGHGKSALLDAMTWALWGQARAKSDDELINSGRVDMEVDFEFRVGAVLYRVVRKRRKGTLHSPGRTILEFQVMSGEVWKPLTGTSNRDTQVTITDAVRLDYETFRNSAFLMQGRADEFTLKAAGERKRVLGEILGLSAYDGYEARSKEERRRWDAEARRLEALVGQYAAELQRQPIYEREQRETLEELTGLEGDIVERRTLVESLRETEKQVRLLQGQVDALRREHARATDQAERSERELRRQQAIIEQQQAVLARADEIRTCAAALGAARSAEGELSVKLSRVSALRQQRSTIESAVERESAALQNRIAVLDQEAARLHEPAAAAEGLPRRRAAVDAEAAIIAHAERQLVDQRAELEEQSNLAGQAQAANVRLRADMAELKRKQTELAADGALCPICRTTLGPERKAAISDTYQAEGSDLAALFRKNKDLQAEAESRITGLQTAIRRQDSQLSQEKARLERRRAEIERDERDATLAAARLPEIEQALADLRSQLAGGMFATQHQEKLARTLEEIDAIGYDEPEHRRLRGELQRLANADAEFGALRVAEQAVQTAREAEAKAQLEVAEWRQGVREAALQLVELEAKLREQVDPREQLQRLLDEVAVIEANERNLRLVLGAAQQRLDDCRRYRGLHDRGVAELTDVRGKVQIYDDLSTAFGRKGVQALIIDAVIPEIEDEANRLLARMSNGRMSVALTTQRVTQKGTVTETLDIAVADELGTRAYEMFSGGEAFRINLALRIALSRLLARRAGAPLPTLIVDEGFGTQDAAGRELLLEAVNAVARDFECLIVITHIDELKDQFDRQIRVEKSATGSTVRLI